MPKLAKVLTVKAVERAKVPEGKAFVELADGVVRGLSLRIGKEAKTYYLTAKIGRDKASRKRRRVSIGQ